MGCIHKQLQDLVFDLVGLSQNLNPLASLNLVGFEKVRPPRGKFATAPGRELGKICKLLTGSIQMLANFSRDGRTFE